MTAATLQAVHRLSGGLMHWLRGDAADSDRPAQNLIYRLRAWPQLEEAGRTAVIYRMLSVMSNRPVSRHWMLERSHMQPREIDSLLDQLQEVGALEVIDPSRFPTRR